MSDRNIRDANLYLTILKGKTVPVANLTKSELEQEVCYLIDILEKFDEIASEMENFSCIWRNGYDLSE